MTNFNNIVSFSHPASLSDRLNSGFEKLSECEQQWALEQLQSALEGHDTSIEQDSIAWDLAFNSADGDDRAEMDADMQALKDLLGD